MPELVSRIAHHMLWVIFSIYKWIFSVCVLALRQQGAAQEDALRYWGSNFVRGLARILKGLLRRLPRLLKLRRDADKESL